MSYSAQQLNDMFAHRVSSNEGRDKLAETGGSFIRDRLREVSFARKVLPPQTVTRQDCQRSVNHDTLVKIIDIEPRTRAMSISFRGEPTARLIRAERVECSFFTISSEKLEKTEQELMAYEMPVTKIMEDNTVKDMQEIEDREFLLHCEAAVQALQLEANGTAQALSATAINAGTVVEVSVRKGEIARGQATNSATVHPLQATDLVQGYKMLDRNRLKCEVVLMTESDFDDVMSWTVEDFGDRVKSETIVDGYKYNKIQGRSIVRTIKTDILREGNLYFFAAPDFFGRFYVLNATKFYIDKVANKISMQAWEDVGMVLANVAAVRKVELYSADANPTTNADSLLSRFIPESEENLGALNNRVGSGMRFPSVNTF